MPDWLKDVIGVALVVAAVTYAMSAAWPRATDKPKKGVWLPLSVGLFVLFAGLVLTFQGRITEITVRGIGSIKTATEQAITDAGAVAEIRQRVENQSATVDLVVAQSTRAKELSESAEKQVKDAATQLTELKDSVSKAQNLLDDLRRQSDVTTMITKAQNDDRVSFDDLKHLANDRSNKYSDLAANAYNTIYKAHCPPAYGSNMYFPWDAAGVDPKSLTLQQLQTFYPSIPAYLRPAFLEYFWRRDDLPKLARLDFLIKVVDTDSSLSAVEYAGRYFAQGTSQQMDPVAVDYFLNWWKQHRQEFEATK